MPPPSKLMNPPIMELSLCLDALQEPGSAKCAGRRRTGRSCCKRKPIRSNVDMQSRSDGPGISSNKECKCNKWDWTSVGNDGIQPFAFNVQLSKCERSEIAVTVTSLLVLNIHSSFQVDFWPIFLWLSYLRNYFWTATITQMRRQPDPNSNKLELAFKERKNTLRKQKKFIQALGKS